MIFDTDIIIWLQRGNLKAASLIEKDNVRMISIQTYMELLQCVNNKKQQQIIRNFLREFDFTLLPLTENIGHRASIYIEEYSMVNGLRAGDAIIAASAIENDVMLATGNYKHYKIIPNLELHPFKPK